MYDIKTPNCCLTLTFKKIKQCTTMDTSKSIPYAVQDTICCDNGVTTNSATATNCVSLYDLRGIH